jgi:cephalosporin hydroxylase
VVIVALLKIFEIDTFIETGTQHGISAFAVTRCSAEKNLRLSMHSIDVGSTYLVKRQSEVNYIRLKRPARKIFKKITLNIPKRKTMFFHDSDHTYENMHFEFIWAWNILGVEILVSDDIDLNNAYSNFCSENSLREYRIKMDSGTTIGVTLRQDNKTRES